MMNEDAAQKSDSGEKFNGSSQRRKKPKKVNCRDQECLYIDMRVYVLVCNVNEITETMEHYE